MNQVYLTGLLDGILSRQPLPSWVVSVLLKHGWHQDEDVPPAEKEVGFAGKGKWEGGGDNSLVSLTLRFQDGVALRQVFTTPVPQVKAFAALGRLVAELGGKLKIELEE